MLQDVMFLSCQPCFYHISLNLWWKLHGQKLVVVAGKSRFNVALVCSDKYSLTAVKKY